MKKLPFFLCFLILISNSSAFLDTQQSKDIIANTLLINSNKETTYKKGDIINIHAHVFNASGLLMNGTSTDCNFHFYNGTNFHLITSNMDEYFDGFNYTIPSNYTQRIGLHGYDIWCNTTNVGGIVSSNFEITESGIINKDSNFSIAIIISLGIIILVLFLLSNYVKIEAIKYLLISVAVIVTVILLAISILIAKEGLPNSIQALTSTSYIVVLYTLDFVIAIGIIFVLFYYISKWLPDSFKFKKKQ